MILRPRIEVVFPTLCRRNKGNFTRLLTNKNTWLLDSGRSALYVALQALNLKAGSRVGVMAYNCHSVADMIVAAGLQPVFIDVTKSIRIDLVHLESKAPQLDALIVSHLFGLENDISKVRKICPTIPIIEDCAHAAGITTCGKNGDMAFYSVGRGKLPSIADGGLLVCNNSQYLDSIEHIYDSLPKYTIIKEAILALKTIVYAVAYSPFAYTLLTHRLVSHHKQHAKAIQSEHKTRKMSRLTKLALGNAMTQISQQVQYRTANSMLAQRIMQRLTPTGTQFVSYDSGNHFMDIYLCQEPELVRTVLKKVGIDSATHFGQSMEWNQRYGQIPNECPTSEWLTHHLLAIPTYTYKAWNQADKLTKQLS